MDDDYDIPFDGMSDEDFLYYAMDPDSPMYMGGPTHFVEIFPAETEEEYQQRVEDWREARLDKLTDAFENFMDSDDDDPTPYFDDIDYDPFPQR